jgi:phage gpG-like protein
MSVTVKGDKQLIRRLEAVKRGPVLKDIQIRAVKEAKNLVPRQTGHLGRSIMPGSLTEAFAIVEANANYAAFVELGTRAHDIVPRNAKMLSWTTGKRLSGRARSGKAAGQRIFAKRVRHPGTKAQPFLLPGAVEAVKQVGVEPIIKAWNDAA